MITFHQRARQIAELLVMTKRTVQPLIQAAPFNARPQAHAEFRLRLR